MHRVPANQLQMESSIEYTNTTALVCQRDLFAVHESCPKCDSPTAEIKPTPLSSEKRLTLTLSCMSCQQLDLMMPSKAHFVMA